MLNLGYPGGPVIERLAKTQNGDAIRFPRTLLDKQSLDFSFSGLKSAVARHIHDHKIESDDDKELFIAAVEEAVSKEMTYAQIDEFLSEQLAAELYQIIKDHPSLTKDFIRTKRG